MRSGGAYRLGTPDPVLIIELAITTWCNYRCEYCVTTVQPKRGESQHAFDHHTPEAWVAAFARIPSHFALLCRGGEPFLDHAGFGGFLAGMSEVPQLQYLRVDTNGSWSPEHYTVVPLAMRERVRLNVSYHPTQIRFETFARRIAQIRDAGWRIGMINYVLEDQQTEGYEAVRDYFRAHHDLYVNPNPDAFDPAWTGSTLDRRAAVDKLVKRLPMLDLARKTGIPTAGRACFFPSLGFFVGPDGIAERACGVRHADEPARFDFLADTAHVRPRAEPARCPQPTCLCLDRYAFLDGSEPRGTTIDLLDEYVRDGEAHQHST